MTKAIRHPHILLALFAMGALPFAAHAADDGIVGKWGPANDPGACGTDFIQIDPDNTATVSMGEKRKKFTFTLEGSVMIVTDGQKTERTPFKVDADELVLNSGGDGEAHFKRCKA